MIDLQANALACAAICASKRDCVADYCHRSMLHAMCLLWKLFDKDFEGLPNAQILAEFESLSDLHTRVLATTNPTSPQLAIKASAVYQHQHEAAITGGPMNSIGIF